MKKIHTFVLRFIWEIADEVLRGVLVRGTYREVIFPVTVIRHLDLLLEQSNVKALSIKKPLDKIKAAIYRLKQETHGHLEQIVVGVN